MTGKYFITTFGCQMNVHDSEILAGNIDRNGLLPGFFSRRSRFNFIKYLLCPGECRKSNFWPYRKP